eukprot:1755480-Alexandrium_andersonii.AAC.1
MRPFVTLRGALRRATRSASCTVPQRPLGDICGRDSASNLGESAHERFHCSWNKVNTSGALLPEGIEVISHHGRLC